MAVSTLPGVGEVRARLESADPMWLLATAACAVGSMLGFVRALWAAFDRMLPWRRALVLGVAEQGANVLLPAGGAGGPALGAYVLRRLGVPGDARRRAPHGAVPGHQRGSLRRRWWWPGLPTGVGALPGHASPVWTLVPAAVAARRHRARGAVRDAAAARAPDGGRVRTTVWRVRRFLHDSAATTLHLLRHGDPYFVIGARSATSPSTSPASPARSRRSAAARRRSASSSSPTRSATRARCCPRRAASAAPRAA